MLLHVELKQKEATILDNQINQLQHFKESKHKTRKNDILKWKIEILPQL
jgi:hypothetical protein